MAEGGSALLKAVVLGATGATGKHVVGYLLKNKDKVDKVTVIGRRKFEFTDELKERYSTTTSAEEGTGRLVQHAEDLDSVSDDTLKTLCRDGDVLFNCLGSTRAKAGSANAFFHIDCEIPERICTVAKSVDLKHVSLLTSQGANPNSWLLYPRTKGEIEERTKQIGFNHLTIFRPGLLGRGEGRFVEKVVGLFMQAMPVEDLAKAMVQDSLNVLSASSEGTAPSDPQLLRNTDITRISGTSSL